MTITSWNLTLDQGTLNGLPIFTVVGLPEWKRAVISNPGDGWHIDTSRFDGDANGDIIGAFGSKEEALKWLQGQIDAFSEALAKSREGVRSDGWGFERR